ncbi:MAG: S8 family serine peptidase [Terrimicrobiaceae bacterium]|nr:S8 family serine peptidase [Terrimicrobiaceae bacterium]
MSTLRFLFGAALLGAVVLLFVSLAGPGERDQSGPAADAAPVNEPTQVRDPQAAGQKSSATVSSQPAVPNLPSMSGSTVGNSAPGASNTASATVGSATPPSRNAAPSDDGSRDFAEEIIQVLEGADLSNPETRAAVVAAMSVIEDARMEAVLAKAARLDIPLEKMLSRNRIGYLHDFRGDEPIYRAVSNSNAAISSGANLLAPAPYSLTGSGMRVGVWDGGSVRASHQEFTGRVTLRNASARLDDHATHVAGTIAAAGVMSNARGMAPAISVDSYDWNSDTVEMTAAGAATVGDSGKLSISNHSYGYEGQTAFMGVYDETAEQMDALAYSLPYYLPFWAAGNDQDFLTSLGGYQSITFHGLAKNLLTVGAVNDAVSGGTRSPANGTMSTFSSWGPTDDGRIKPDVVANGVGVYSPISTGNTAYDIYSGTSMASPSAAGSAALLTQLWAREFSNQRMRASLLKGLLIHTADDLGTAGPDYRFGWGLINVKAAADLILAHKASLDAPKLIENSVTNTQRTRTHTFVWDGTSPIRVTLSWTDPAGTAQTATDSRTSNLVNNLNLTVTAPNGTTVHRPFVMPFVGTWTRASMELPATTGTNNTDNVEQVLVGSPVQAGTYTITVTSPGTVTNTTQAYSLIVSGGVSVQSNPPPNVTLTAPTNGLTVLANQAVTVSATATDLTATGAAGLVSQVEFFAGAASLGVDTAAPYSLSWTPTVSGIYQITARATDSEGAISTSVASSVNVLSGSGLPTISAFSPTAAAVGETVTIDGTNFAGVTAVRFHGIDALSFTVVSPSQITTTVPPGATTGPISIVNGFGTATSVSNFTVNQPPVLISQIYGGGGNSGAPLNADYVELRNSTNASVSLAGWSVQYASANGTSWSATSLSGSIPANGYYLVQLGSGASGSPLPTPNATGSSNLSATSGKVALRNSATAFTGSTPVGQTGLQDFVGYGVANAYKGTAAAPSGSNTMAIFRAGGGTVDTGDNAADFTAASPGPRNSSGSVVAPAITSPSLAGGTVGSSFSYQITASNGPTSYGATGLPPGLSVNTASGLISGTPTTTGTYNATVFATNSAGTGSLGVTITIVAGGGGGTITIFSENMGTPSGTTQIAAHTFQNSALLTFSGNADARSTQASAGYTNASGAGNIFFNAGLANSFQIAGINTSGYSSLQLSVGHYKDSVAANNELIIEVSSDGTNFTQLSYSRATGSGTANWILIQPTGSIPATANLRIRFRQTSSTAQFRIDDVRLTGAASSTPTITLSGTPAAVNAIYGSPSVSPTSFVVSGSNLAAGVQLSAPSGFEISQSSGSGYASSLTVGSTGTLANTTIYARLAAGSNVGTYSGSVTATSSGALPVTLPLAASDVRRKALTITANDRSKPFGATLALGTSAFSASGLVGTETVGSVTLTAAGGTALYDAPGVYQIVPSAATGGTFAAANYDIGYQAGSLTVTAPGFSEWLPGTLTGGNASAGGDPDADGVPNLVEYFSGLDAVVAGVMGVPQVSVESSQVHLIYRRAKGTQGVTGLVEWSGTLAPGSWSTSGVTDSLLSDEGPYELRRATAPANQTGRQFLRLRVTTP